MGYNLRLVFISFTISFIILFPLGVFLILNFLDMSDENRGDVVSTNGKFQFLIPKTYDLNFIFVNFNELDGRNLIEALLLCKISAHNNSISLVEIPIYLKTIVQNKLDSLQGFFDYGGISFLNEAVQNLLGVKIDRTIQSTDESIQSAINCLGGLKVKFDDPNTNLPIKDDSSVIGGEFFCKLLKQNPLKSFILLQYGFCETTNLDRFFAYFANMFKTNISAYDFEIRKKGFEQLINSKNVKLNLPKLDFIKFNDRDKLTDSSRAEVELLF